MRGEVVSFRVAFDALRQVLPLSELALATLLPRGTIQTMHVTSLPESLVRAYHREFQPLDRFAWSLLLRNRLLTTTDPDLLADPVFQQFSQRFLRPHGIGQVMGMPMPGVLLPGYPGVLFAIRSPEQADFTPEDAQSFRSFAAELGRLLQQAMVSRGGTDLEQPSRFLVFNSAGDVLNASAAPDALPKGVLPRLRDYVVARLDGRLSRKRSGGSDRVHIPDDDGLFAVFRVFLPQRFPAIADGPVAIVCQIPEPRHWALLRPGDFDADPELARLVPAARYIVEHFSSGPTLHAIAAVAQLSPFHFHRQFSEMLGITPKHLLFDLQIEMASRLVRNEDVELSEIARRCGFAHQSHFTSRFRQATGLTPTRWRSLMKSRHGSATA